jgi:hypothetical protein
MMTEEEFYKKYRILYVAGDELSFVSIVNKFNKQQKKYNVNHVGQKINIDSIDYTNMPDWIWAKIKPQIFNDYNVNDNGN